MKTAKEFNAAQGECIKKAEWIVCVENIGDISPVYRKIFSLEKPVKSAKLHVTALGMYKAELNSSDICGSVFNPGLTNYKKRLQYQTYDVTRFLKSDNELRITVGKGWFFGDYTLKNDSKAAIASLHIKYEDGSEEFINTDAGWQATGSNILYSDIYNGEIYDASICLTDWKKVKSLQRDKDVLIPQEGEKITEHEKLPPLSLIITPKGEKALDFGQNIAGYVHFKLSAKKGDIVELSHAEVLDENGNFYTDNLRTAKQKIKYTCKAGQQDYKPSFTFQGFRFVRLDSYPHENIDLSNFEAVVVHSDMKKTGYFESSDVLLNKLFQNIIWGQKGNFVDIPTDCPQRDERMGWMGDAQVFIKTASYNFDVNRFFVKWIHDMISEQFPDGGVAGVIPMVGCHGLNAAGWADAAVICPWQIYLTYNNKDILRDSFDMMKKWIDYIRAQGENEYLWNTGRHYGDWLGLDAGQDSYTGATDKYLIATAFYAYSTSLFIKAGKVLGKDMTFYETLYKNIVSAYRKEYIKDGKLVSNTQTAHVLTLYFDLAQNGAELAENLVKLITENGNKLSTGFLGTPYLLHALTKYGYNETAYELLLRKEYPSWLYPVTKDATTVWEHWDGIKPDGGMWSADMNSFNHYAYGAVADWLYEHAAGITIDEKNPGFKHIIFKPLPTKRLNYVKACIDTGYGTVSSKWEWDGDKVCYEFSIPDKCTATAYIGEKALELKSGTYKF